MIKGEKNDVTEVSVVEIILQGNFYGPSQLVYDIKIITLGDIYVAKYYVIS